MSGATTVTLSGSGFTGATRVTLTSGTRSVTAIPTVLSDSSLRFTTPSIAKLAGLTSLVFKVSVAVGTTTSAPNATALFTYRAPVLTKVAPNSGPVSGATTVTLSGSGFTGATRVTLTSGTRSVTAIPTVLSDSSLRFTTPSIAKLAGLTSLVFKVSVAVGTTTSAPNATALFTYRAPVLTKVAPNSGPVSGATTVTLSGSGFTGATRVTLTSGTRSVTAIPTVLSDSSLRFTTPSIAKLAGLTSLVFKVSVAVGTTTSAPNATALFTYRAPVLTKVAPNSGPVSGATTVTLSGSGFTGATRVTLTSGTRSVTAIPTVLSDSSLRFTTPSIAKLAGLTSLVFKVSVAVGTTTSAPNATALFTYRAPKG